MSTITFIHTIMIIFILTNVTKGDVDFVLDFLETIPIKDNAEKEMAATFHKNGKVSARMNIHAGFWLKETSKIIN